MGFINIPTLAVSLEITVPVCENMKYRKRNRLNLSVLVYNFGTSKKPRLCTGNVTPRTRISGVRLPTETKLVGFRV